MNKKLEIKNTIVPETNLYSMKDLELLFIFSYDNYLIFLLTRTIKKRNNISIIKI